MARRGFDTFALPRSGSISKAVVGRTQMRSTLDHPHRIGHLLLPHVATRVRRGATRASRGDVPIARCVVRSENVGGPLPHISGHVRQAISVDTEGSHRRGSDEPVLGPVLPRKASLPRVCQVPAPWSEFIAPDEPRTIETASCRELPFHLCGEVLACPVRVGERIEVRDVCDRMPLPPARLLPGPPDGASRLRASTSTT